MASERIEERLLNVRETAQVLGISPRQVHRLRSAGRICPFLKVGGSVRVRMSTLTDWLNMNCPNLEEFLVRKEAEQC